MKDNLNLTVRSALKKGDFRRLAYWNMFGRKPAYIYLAVIVLIIGSLGIYFSGGNLVMLAVSMVVVFCPVLVIAITEYNIASVRRGGDIIRRTSAEYTFGSGGVSAKSIVEKAPTFYDWKHIYKAYENKLFFIILINKVQMLTVRKTDLAPGDEETLRVILEKNTSFDKRSA